MNNDEPVNGKEFDIREMVKSEEFNPLKLRAELKKLGFRRKSSMRNIPCPCESGKKTKNCCWPYLPR